MQKTKKQLLAFGLTAVLSLTTAFADTGMTAKAATQSTTTEGGAITKADGEKYASTNDVYVPDNPAVFRDLTSDELITEMGNGWNLGNTLDGHDEDFNPSETTWLESKVSTSQEFITYLHDIGYNTIRIPVTWGTMINDDYSINETWMSRVQDIIDYAIHENMYVILNIHHDGTVAGWLNLDADEKSNPDSANYDATWTKNWDNGGWDGVKTKFAGVWTTIASRFQNYDEHLIFEAMNEVYSGIKGGWTDNTADIKAMTRQINELNQLFVDTVRATGGNNGQRWLMASALNTSISYALNQSAGFKIPTDTGSQKHIMLSVHDYDNFNSSSATESYSGNGSYAYQFNQLYKKFVSAGVPVVIGEYGFLTGGLSNLRASQYEGVNYLLKKYHLVGCAWDNNGSASGDGYRLLKRGYMKPYSVKAIAGTLRGFFKDTEAPELITVDNYKDIPNNNITDITLEQSELTLQAGDSKTVTWTETPADNNDVVLWSSSDSTVASVYNGKIIARGIGETTITARTMSSDMLDGTAAKKTIKVTVTANADTTTTDITTDFAAYTLYKDEEAFLNAAAVPADNTISISYRSSNPSIVSVSTTGKLTALKLGSATITVLTSDGFQKDIPVTVKSSSDSSFKSTVQLRVLYNYNKTADDYYGSTEFSTQTVDITKDGQYSLTFDCATDLSEAAKKFGISTINGIGALYIKDTAAVSEIKTGEIVYDSIVINDTEELTITDKTPKSIVKGTVIDTGNPINGWDGSVVSSDDINTTSNGCVTFKNIANPTKITVNFTLSNLSSESQDTEFYRGTEAERDASDDNVVPNVETAKTDKLSAASSLIIAAGSSKTIAYKATAADGASKPANVTAVSNYSKVKVSVNETTQKLTIKVDKSAVKGKTAVITLSSDGAKSIQIKVKVKNAAKKLTASKKSVTIKKGKTATLTFKVTSANNKLAVTDTLKTVSSKKAIAKITSQKLSAGKIQLKVKGLKKGSSKLTVKVGSKKAIATVKVK